MACSKRPGRYACDVWQKRAIRRAGLSSSDVPCALAFFAQVKTSLAGKIHPYTLKVENNPYAQECSNLMTRLMNVRDSTLDEPALRALLQKLKSATAGPTASDTAITTTAAVAAGDDSDSGSDASSREGVRQVLTDLSNGTQAFAFLQYQVHMAH